MTALRVQLAHDASEIRGAQSVRAEVYGEQERMLSGGARKGGLEVDARDFCNRTTHVLVLAANRPVATARLIAAAPEAARASAWDLDVTEHFRLTGFELRKTRVAEISRFCILREWRHSDVVHLLVDECVRVSTERGYTHWIAAANSETDSIDDAKIAYHVAESRGLVSRDFRAEPILPERVPLNPQRPLYTPEQRKRAGNYDWSELALPRILAFFATRLGARYMGLPIYEEYFKVCALPLVAAVEDVRQARRSSRSRAR